MHLLLMGSRGQLGRALQDVYRATPGVRVIAGNRPEYDLANPALADQVAALAPDVVVNCAAWTDVDGAESNPAVAYGANALGPHYLAEGCHRCGALLVQVSTNEVFAGEPGRFYREYDEPQPGSVYARSKLAGERAVTQRLDRLIIARVAWLFGVGGANFPSKIVAAADKHGALRVVHDEWGNPTYAPDAAAAIARLIERNRSGIYHVVNDGKASRFELAQAVLQATGRSHIPLTPIAHTEWPRPALPPLHAVLANQAAAALGIQLRPWQEAVQEYGKGMGNGE
jgi:dTDP-4-dehydrorhamnose reductase